MMLGDRDLSLVYTILGATVGMASPLVPKPLAYIAGVVVLAAAFYASKKKISGFKKQAAGLAFLYLSVWLISWTLATNP